MPLTDSQKATCLELLEQIHELLPTFAGDTEGTLARLLRLILKAERAVQAAKTGPLPADLARIIGLAKAHNWQVSPTASAFFILASNALWGDAVFEDRTALDEVAEALHSPGERTKTRYSEVIRRSVAVSQRKQYGLLLKRDQPGDDPMVLFGKKLIQKGRSAWDVSVYLAWRHAHFLWPESSPLTEEAYNEQLSEALEYHARAIKTHRMKTKALSKKSVTRRIRKDF